LRYCSDRLQENAKKGSADLIPVGGKRIPENIQ
jgi:hypothetical protein